MLSRISLTVDYDQGQMTLTAPSKSRETDSNLLWLGYPTVRLLDEEGMSLLFGLEA